MWSRETGPSRTVFCYNKYSLQFLAWEKEKKIDFESLLINKNNFS